MFHTLSVTTKQLVAATALATGFSLLPAPAQAGPVTVTSLQTSFALTGIFGTQLINTVNGVGMPGGVTVLEGEHARDTLAGWYWGYPQSPVGTIDYGFAGPTLVDGLSFWNWTGCEQCGVGDVEFFASLDGVNFTAIAGAPTHFEAGNASAQRFSFSAPVQASVIRMSVLSNLATGPGPYGMGYMEIAFSEGVAATQVPEPGSLALVGAALVAGAAARRRQQRRHRAGT